MKLKKPEFKFTFTFGEFTSEGLEQFMDFTDKKVLLMIIVHSDQQRNEQ